MNKGKVIGGILLVSGTTIGASLLGLPVTCAFMGFYPSIALFIFCWLFMLGTGIFFVDITCDIKRNVNIITMAEKTIGRWGMGLSWISYLLLLYSLIALYIAGSAPLFQKAFLDFFSINIPDSIVKFFLPALFGWIIYLGTRGVDLINRYLMFGLIISYFLLVSFLPEHVKAVNLEHYSFKPIIYALPFILTGFGYHIIIPSLGFYMKYDKKMMIYSVIIGSVISLIINLLWQFMVLGAMPLKELALIWQKGVPITTSLSQIVQSNIVFLGVYFFSFFAILTSFLGVSLSLSDFLMDGLKIKKRWDGRLFAILLTFLPPLIFVYTYERGFYLALQYAGAFVAILLVFIPAAMVWKLKGHSFYKSITGKLLLLLTMLFAFCVVGVNILIRWGVFTKMLKGIGGI